MRAEGKITMMDLNVRENVHAHVPCVEGGGGGGFAYIGRT